MNRIKRFIKAVDWKSTAIIVVLFLFITLSYGAFLRFQFNHQNLVAIGFFWAWFVGYPIYEIWKDTKNDQ